jgi:hypothetical protein
MPLISSSSRNLGNQNSACPKKKFDEILADDRYQKASRRHTYLLSFISTGLHARLTQLQAAG